MNNQLQEVINMLAELQEDKSSNKKIKEKSAVIVQLLQQGSEVSLEKAVLVLEELSSLEMSSYHRTQVWDILSSLESVKADLISQS